VDVYQSNTRVTGQREETRLPGLARCFIDQMVKASGDPALAEHPAVIAMSRDSSFAIREYAYRDLYAGRPIMDEQGTRDRPYELTVFYRPDKIDAALSEVGREPWGKNRPKVLVVLKVDHIARNFVLTSHSEEGDLMRESFDLAAYKFGVPVSIVRGSLLEASGLRHDNLTADNLAAITALAAAAGTQSVLFGELAWDRRVHGWRANWHMQEGTTYHQWHIEGVNFDAAFRHALSGAALILSGNGMPK
jgi:hypothetical protein